jgi:prophage regulatory protein
MTRLLRLPEVIERTGLSRSRIYELLDQDGFPRPVKLGERANAWADVEIEDWIQRRLAAR